MNGLIVDIQIYIFFISFNINVKIKRHLSINFSKYDG